MKTGDRVICINAKGASGLIKEREYIVYDSIKCNCGTHALDVGFKHWLTSSTNCPHCDSPLSTVNDTQYFYVWRFAKVKTQYKVVKMDIEIEEPIYN